METRVAIVSLLLFFGFPFLMAYGDRKSSMLMGPSFLGFFVLGTVGGGVVTAWKRLTSGPSVSLGEAASSVGYVLRFVAIISTVYTLSRIFFRRRSSKEAAE